MADNRRLLSIDLETYSDVDLAKCGVYRYVEGDFHILLFAYAFDDGDADIIDLACGEQLPQEVVDAIFDDSIIKAAWNAQFERTCLSKYFNTRLSPDSWQCSMVWAASLSLPLKLKTAAEVLKTGEQKDDAGERLIKYFSVPCKPTKANGGRTRNLPEHAPEDWARFKEYCCQDVRTERAIRKRLEQFPLPDSEWEHYHMDQRINDRGVMIDRDLVTQAITCDLMMSEEMTKKAYELTGLENPNSVSQLKGWLEERGISVDTLGKKDVSAMITDLDKHSVDGEALEMMKLRLQMAKSSVKKYQAAERCICNDGRAHGLFQFSGAVRTQRWSGRLIQLQNLYRNEISTLDEARELVKLGCFNMVESIYGNTPDILSQLIRTMLIPKPGCEFIIADFSAIEARVLAWLAGEQWRIDAFKRGDDIYCASASQMFGVPVVKHGINGELRAKGKVAELACIAENELVLTDQGLVPIQNVSTHMKIWDGEEWISHDGVIYRGEREVITYEGLTATPDHLVWVEGQSQPIQFGIAAASGSHLVQTGDGRRAIRLGENNKPGEKMVKGLAQALCTDRVSGMWNDSVDASRKFDQRSFKRMSELHSAKTDSKMARPPVDRSKTKVRKSKRSRISKLWGKRNKVRISECYGGRTLFDSEIWSARQKNGNRPYRHKRKLFEGQFKVCRSQNKLCKSTENSPKSIRAATLAVCEERSYSETVAGIEQSRNNCGCGNGCIREKEKLAFNKCTARLYDIRNAGRHHRFTVSGKLVHNCGYGGGTGALISMGALDMGLKETELSGLIDDWRTANPHIVQFWYAVEKAAVDTIKDYQDRTVGKIGFQFYANTLWIVLPSGRKLAYIKPRLQPNRFGRMAVTFEGLNAGNKWVRTETYNGRLTENLCQSTARDLLAEAMRRMELAGLEIVAHVHDEVIIEAPIGKTTVEEVCSIMNQNPLWAEGLPLSSAGYIGEKFYFKD